LLEVIVDTKLENFKKNANQKYNIKIINCNNNNKYNNNETNLEESINNIKKFILNFENNALKDNIIGINFFILLIVSSKLVSLLLYLLLLLQLIILMLVMHQQYIYWQFF
jgi:hypothetical protein